MTNRTELDIDDVEREEVPPAALEETLDRISLRQALVDFEVANARVIDLTARLLEAQQELAQRRVHRSELEALQAEAGDLRAQLDEVTARHEAVITSRTYRLLHVIARIRVRVGV